jgi:eukaryotic-like serine/threonine-protein kinase
LHEAQVVHRRIDASTIALTRTGEAVISELADAVGADGDAQLATAAHTVVGTPAFAAPELFEDVPQSAASDIYALGVAFLWAHMGESPYADRRLMWPQETPANTALLALLREMTAADPAARPSASAIADRAAAAPEAVLAWLGPAARARTREEEIARALDEGDEARALGRIRHPNVIEVLDYSGRDAPLPFLVLDLIEGVTLGHFLALTAFPELVAAALGLRIAEALEAVHNAGLVHRDVKPENIFVDEQGRIVLGDFGIVLGAEGEGTFAGGKTAAVGSPRFAAPEQVFEPDRVDARSDLFALGATLYALIRQRSPFHAATVSETLQKLSQARVEPLPGTLSAEFRALVAALLQRDQARRPKSAADVANALRQILQSARELDATACIVRFLRSSDDRTAIFSRTTLLRPPSIGSETKKKPKRPRSPLVLAAIVLTLAAGALLVALRTRSAKPSAGEMQEQSSPAVVPSVPVPPPIEVPPPIAVPPPMEAPTVVDRAPAATTPAVVRFFTRPWAKVMIDGRPYGTTPFFNTTRLSPGEHVIRFESPGWKPQQMRVTLAPGEKRDLRVNLVEQ